MQSATRVVRVIEHLAAHPLSRLDDIAELLGVHKSNASRLLSTLRELDWVSANDDRTQFSLGPRMIVLGRAAAPGDEFAVAQRLAAGLAAATGETVNLSIAGVDSMVTVGEVPSNYELRVSQSIGSTDPFHSSAVGKLHLAGLGDSALEATLDRIELTDFTTSTIVDRAALRDELARIRAAGYSTNIGEQRDGISAFALPLTLRDSLGRPLLMSLTAPSVRWSRDRIDAHVAELLLQLEPYLDRVVRQGG